MEGLQEESKTAEDEGAEDPVLSPPEDRWDDDKQGQQEAGDEFSCGMVGYLPWTNARLSRLPLHVLFKVGNVPPG